ncbi:DNA binding protein [Gordonia phage LuckyLeo]|nr:DNA binding protein [Gordonia phage LuckyLeo]
METLAEPKNGYVIREEGPKAICRHCGEPIYRYQPHAFSPSQEEGWAHSRTFMVGCQPFNRPRSAQVESGQT